MKLIYETIYKKMDKLGLLDIQEYKKLISDGYMDLSIDVLNDNKEHKTIALAHNFIQNGDVMADPDMEIKIHKDLKMAEALTYQLDSLGVFQCVYSDDGKKVNLALKKQLNSFLNKWLTNLINQGFSNIKEEN